MFGRLSTKIRPSAALVSALCVTLVIGTNTFAFANDGDLAGQSDAHITEVNSADVSVESAEGAQSVVETSESDAPATAPAAPEPSTSEAVSTPAENADTAPTPTSRSPFRKAEAAAVDELSIHMSVKADGTPDDDRTGDGRPDFTVDNTPGNDASATNGIVRVNDTVTYTLEYRSKVGTANNFTAKIVFPKGLYVTQLPAVCRQPGSSLNPIDPTANVTLPLTANSRDQLEEQTLLCNLGTTETSTLKIEIVAKVSNLVGNGENLTIKSISAAADGVAEVPTDDVLPKVTTSAALKWDVTKNSMSTKDGEGYAYGPLLERCFWDNQRLCFGTVYNLLILAPIAGKGVMPAVGDVTITDDLSPEALFAQIPAEKLPEIKANLDKYGSRVQNVGRAVYAAPGHKIGAKSEVILTEENSVRDSGTLQVEQPNGPGTPAILTVKNADFTLRTYPTEAARPVGSAVPANKAYAVAHAIRVHTPVELVKDYGQEKAGERSLDIKNTYTNFSAQGFTVADRQTEDIYEGNNWLGQKYRIGPPGDFLKYFGGDAGNPSNTPPVKFNPANTWHGEGLPGGSTFRSGDTGVAGTQDVVALVLGTGPSALYDATLPTIVCDAWDNSKLHLKEKNWKGATYKWGRGVGSEGKAVWITGYNNVLNPAATAAIDADRPEQVPALKVQYSANPGGGLADSTCGDDKGPWYDNPAEVPDNDPEKAARGVFTAVSRARAHYVAPPAVGFFSNIANGYLVNVAFGFEVAPGLEPGTIIPNWASTKRVISTDKANLTMDQVLAEDSAPWSASR